MIQVNIPFFNLTRQNEKISKEIEKQIHNLISRGDFIEGKAVKEFEEQVKSYLNVKHVITCANGTEALELALIAAGVKPGDEVITTPFTFIATAEAIVSVGATPVFADIRIEDFNLEPTSVESKITGKTKVILPVHIFGVAAKMDELFRLSKKYHLKIIEDACQAIGAEYKGKRVGALGDVAGFSFYPTKNLGAFGDAGMVTTNNDEIAIVCRALKSHGAGKIGAKAHAILDGEKMEEEKSMTTKQGYYDPYKYYNYIIGGNSRLDSVQAIVLKEKLKYLDLYNKKRNEIAKRYCKGLKNTPLRLPCFENGSYCCWHQFAVLVEEKDIFCDFLSSRGIGTGAFYPVPLHLQKSLKNLGYKEGMLPIVENVCKKSVCLPIFPELTEDEIDYVIDTIYEYYHMK